MRHSYLNLEWSDWLVHCMYIHPNDYIRLKPDTVGPMHTVQSKLLKVRCSPRHMRKESERVVLRPLAQRSPQS